MTTVIAVAEYTGRQARFTARLSAAFAAAGLVLQLRTHRELAREVSVEQPPGQPPAVTPDRPLLWLAPGDGAWPDSADERFLAAETLAAARSVALLTRSPVLNRPSEVALAGTLPPGPARASRGARQQLAGAVRAEGFTSRWPPEAAGTGAVPLEVHDYASGRSRYGPPPSSPGPFRYRAGVSPARLVKVRVIGDQVISPAGTGPAVLDASRRLAGWYQLDLAGVWWLVAADGARTLARVDCWEWDDGAAPDPADDVAGAVAAWMAGRLGQDEGPRW
jgi:hypothetical protein